MVKKFFSIITIVLLFFTSCEKEFYKLNMDRIPYIGNELNIDGYYYSNQVYNRYIGVAVFYKNGVCINVFTKIEGQDTLSYIENDILLNKSVISRFMSTPTNIGVFQINNDSIQFETWEAGRDIITFSNYGKILNDTTFVITKQVNNFSGDVDSEKMTYRFKLFSPKPDSTNTFIE